MRYCSFLKKRSRRGNRISHSHIRTGRWFKPNIIKKRIYVEELGKWITVKMSAKALKKLSKKTLLQLAKEKGVKLSIK